MELILVILVGLASDLTVAGTVHLLGASWTNALLVALLFNLNHRKSREYVSEQ
jgi:hypothetical protein